MGVLIKVFIRSIVGVVTVGLLGCGFLFPSTPNRPPNLYTDLYEGESLRYKGKYREALAKYEQAAKKFRHLSVDTKIIHVSFPTFLKYHIAFCYAELAETEVDVSLYNKAEAAAEESYRTAIIPSNKTDALYLWAYILFKQERYAEARAKFEKLLETLRQNEFDTEFTVDALFGLGKAHLELGNEPTARQTFVELEARIRTLLRTDNSFYATQVLFGLGKIYMELGDEPTARRVFAQLFEIIKIELQESFIGYDAEIFYENTLYELGKIYLALGDKAATRRAFAQFLKHFPDSSYKPEVKRLLEKQ